MESVLRALGIRSEVASPATSAPSRSSLAGKSDDAHGENQEVQWALDLAIIAAQTEEGILALQEEARNLRQASLAEAHALLAGWAKALQRRPRPDEPLASFKARFLRSNVLERAVEGLRQNEHLKRALLDKPLFAAPDGGSGPAQDLLKELQGLLQLCFPRAASMLVAPLVEAAFQDETQSLAGILIVIRAFKEDWTEVVRGQALRSLERNLDLLEYELQKCPKIDQMLPRPVLSRKAEGGRAVSRDLVLVLSSVCEGITESKTALQSHLQEMMDHLRSMGFEQAVAQSQEKNDLGEGPDEATCEAAVRAMVQKTEKGMREGLKLLGVPEGPLHFVPGVELRLRGHDIRLSVSALITHWIEGEKREFNEVLQRICRLVGQTGRFGFGGESLYLAALEPLAPTATEAELSQVLEELMQEREALFSRVEAVDQRIAEVSERLCREPETSPALPRLPMMARLTRFVPPRSLSRTLPQDLVSLVAAASEATRAEAQRNCERLAQALQIRRQRLLTHFTSHLQSEQAHLASLAAVTCQDSSPRPPGAREELAEHVGCIVDTARMLIQRVEEVVRGPEQDRLVKSLSGESHPCCGTHCRARWLDGHFYDAAIQQVLPDGRIVVNWLRPLAACEEGAKKLVTVSERGGDDTLHRIISKADIILESGAFATKGQLKAAKELFQKREAEDLRCAECRHGAADWASVSFGTYLCAACAEEHRKLGVGVSVVRQLQEGCGWTDLDVEFLRLGGNKVFHSWLDRYPDVKTLPVSARCTSRFGEFYRKLLDAICSGFQAPQAPSPDQAGLQTSSDYVGATEAAELSSEASENFEHVILELSPTLPRALSAISRPSTAPTSQGGKLSRSLSGSSSRSRTGRTVFC